MCDPNEYDALLRVEEAARALDEFDDASLTSDSVLFDHLHDALTALAALRSQKGDGG